MLPSDLARFKIYGDEVSPIFADEKDLELAKSIISTFKPGKKVGDVREEIKVLEDVYKLSPLRVKLIRGLYRVFLREAKLSEDSPIDPRIIRRELYSIGPVITHEDRQKVIKEVSSRLNVNVEKYMFSDLEDEKIIKELPTITPDDLIKAYNLSLLQTMLFKAYKVEVEMEGNWKEVARRIKWLGLMYFAYSNPVRIEILGPATLIKMTEKYGRNMALILPYVVSSKKWRISAEIVLGKKKKRLYKMEIKDFPLILSKHFNEEKFDSTVEEKFYEDFLKNIKGWKIIREPEAIVVGDRLFIPDFVIEKDPFKIYVEIVGFWTKGYIREKIDKLRGLKSSEILILLNEELAKEDFPESNIIKYKGKVNIALVYSWLKRYEETHSNFNFDYSLSGDIVSLVDIAKKLGINQEILRKNLKQVKGYVLLNNYYIKEELFNKLSKMDFSGMRLSEITKVYGDYIIEVLERLGYKFKWDSVIDARVIR
ncbi:DUF790 family protein [Acidianus sp. RZ1]|uniref:DUF790 family protein n=1 Tax=Acidianus sp. RZ1 TaxID=1540082 RepID=UPI001491A252|nr:DUF790 family protein [Acidianus sp. RZ1]NON61344.1 DUF790 family protein [Acidianus sp. RZ1]